MSEQISDGLMVASQVFDPEAASKVLGEFSTLFGKPRQLPEAVGQKGRLRSSTLLEGTAVGRLVDLVDAEAAEHGQAVGDVSGSRPVLTIELAEGRPFSQRLTDKVDGAAFALLEGSVALRLGDEAAILQPGDVAFVDGNHGEATHSISTLPGRFATGLLIGTTERAPELAVAA